MIFKRRKHKLPKFPPSVISTFKGLCEDLNADELKELRTIVELNMQQIYNDAETNEQIDRATLEDLVDRTAFLLDQYEQAPAQVRPMIVGAVRYFAISNDALSETAFASGFTDDVKVMNYVLEELGFEDKAIPLR